MNKVSFQFKLYSPEDTEVSLQRLTDVTLLGQASARRTKALSIPAHGVWR